jgi:hypothetical protein
MSLICRVVMGYFDAQAACAQLSIAPTRPVDEEEVACLEATCDEVFGIKAGLSKHLTRDGMICIEDIVVRGDTYKAAAVAHGLFGMSVVDHAHRGVIFPAEDKPFPDREQLLSFYQSLRLDMDEQQRQKMVEESLQGMRQERELKRGALDRVRSLTAAWQSQAGRSWLTPDVLALARVAYDERRSDVLPVLADGLEEAGCTDQAILDHLRRQCGHPQGCWAVGLMLAKG